ncbi:MAG: apolipoprotein N-acyltransferase [Sinobacteraceae bacterium]|nr:apolipoprotein N-acyltransferase [Nevskiaceae bacterium]
MTPALTEASRRIRNTLKRGNSLQSYLTLFAAGCLSALGFAPLEAWPLTLAGLIWLLHRSWQAPALRAASAGAFVFGTGHFIVGLNWIAMAFTYQANMPAWLGWVAVILLSLYLSIFVALAAGLARLCARRAPLAFVLWFAASWILTEWLRATLLTGFAWNPLAVIWVPLPWLAACAAGIGTYALSGLTVLLAGLAWLAVRANFRVGLPVVVALAALLLVTGRARPAPAGPESSLPFTVVQPDIGQDQKYDPEQEERNSQRYVELSQRAARASDQHPRLLFWPEGATVHFIEIEPKPRLAMAQLLGPGDLLILGGPSVILDMQGDDDVYHNSVFAVDEGAAIRWRYDKAHLVPFGEYLPLRSILGRIGLARLVPGEGDFTPGPGARTYLLPGLRIAGQPASVGVQICYEIIFSGRVVDEAHRPSFLFNPSNDAWFGAWGPPQHLAQARLRAIEEGLPVIRATPNGISAVIGPRGQLLATIERHRAGVINAFMPLALPPTPFSRLGLWLSLLTGGVLVVLGTAIDQFRSRTRMRRMASTPG